MAFHGRGPGGPKPSSWLAGSRRDFDKHFGLAASSTTPPGGQPDASHLNLLHSDGEDDDVEQQQPPQQAAEPHEEDFSGGAHEQSQPTPPPPPPPPPPQQPPPGISSGHRKVNDMRQLIRASDDDRTRAPSPATYPTPPEGQPCSTRGDPWLDSRSQLIVSTQQQGVTSQSALAEKLGYSAPKLSVRASPESKLASFTHDCAWQSFMTGKWKRQPLGDSDLFERRRLLESNLARAGFVTEPPAKRRKAAAKSAPAPATSAPAARKRKPAPAPAAAPPAKRAAPKRPAPKRAAPKRPAPAAPAPASAPVARKRKPAAAPAAAPPAKRVAPKKRDGRKS
jgi:hypothetical protein